MIRPIALGLTALSLTAALALPGPAAAQIREATFADYASYDAFVDETIRSRDFVTLITSLGGSDEYTEEQLAAVERNLLAAFPVDFIGSAVFRTVTLEAGFSQEGRAFWDGEVYGWYNALQHDTGEELRVINFTFNTDSNAIIGRF